MKRERRIRIGFWRLAHESGLKFRVDSEKNKILAFWPFRKQNKYGFMHRDINKYQKTALFSIFGYVPHVCRIILPLSPRSELFRWFRVYVCALPGQRVRSDSTDKFPCGSLYMRRRYRLYGFWAQIWKKLIFNENSQIFTGNEGSEYASDFDARGTKLALFFELN